MTESLAPTWPPRRRVVPVSKDPFDTDDVTRWRCLACREEVPADHQCTEVGA